MPLTLRPVELTDEEPFRRAHDELWASDRFELGLNYDPDEPFAQFVDRHRDFAQGLNLSEGLVPAHFLIAVNEGAIVGRSSIRHQLNDFLAAEGGHIGYGVLAPFRRRGFATEILRQSLAIAESVGIEHALLICDEVNVGSRTVIERCGGKLVSTGSDSDGNPIRRYEVPTA